MMTDIAEACTTDVEQEGHAQREGQGEMRQEVGVALVVVLWSSALSI